MLLLNITLSYLSKLQETDFSLFTDSRIAQLPLDDKPQRRVQCMEGSMMEKWIN